MKSIRRTLIAGGDRSGAQVAVLARIGQNLAEYRLRYSHLGVVYGEGDQWRVVGPNRDRYGRLGVRVVESQRHWRPGAGRSLTRDDDR